MKDLVAVAAEWRDQTSNEEGSGTLRDRLLEAAPTIDSGSVAVPRDGVRVERDVDDLG